MGDDSYSDFGAMLLSTAAMNGPSSSMKRSAGIVGGWGDGRAAARLGSPGTPGYVQC